MQHREMWEHGQGNRESHRSCSYVVHDVRKTCITISTYCSVRQRQLMRESNNASYRSETAIVVRKIGTAFHLTIDTTSTTATTTRLPVIEPAITLSYMQIWKACGTSSSQLPTTFLCVDYLRLGHQSISASQHLISCRLSDMEGGRVTRIASDIFYSDCRCCN